MATRESNPKWRFVLADTKSFENIGELSTAKNKALNFALNKPGSCSFTIRVDDEIGQRIQEISTCVKAYRNGELKWSGPVWTTEDQVPQDVTTVNCIGWLEYLNHRFLLAKQTYTNLDAGQIAQQLFLGTFDYANDAVQPNNPDFTTDISNWDTSGLNTGGTLTRVTTDSFMYGSPNTLDSPAMLMDDNHQAVAHVTTGAFTGSMLKAGKQYIITAKVQPVGMTPANSGRYFGQKMTISMTVGSYSWVLAHTADVIFGLPWNGAHASLDFAYPYPWNNGDGTFDDTYSTLTVTLQPIQDIPVSDLYFHIISTDRYAVLNPGDSPATNAARALIDHVVIQSIDADSDVPITLGFAEASVSRTRTYERNINLGQELQALSEIEAGFDYEIDPETRQLNIYAAKGNTRNVELAYGTGPENVSSATRNVDSSSIANVMIAQGKYSTARADDVDSKAEYGKFFAVDSLTDVADANVLGAYVNEELVFRAQPRVTYQMSPKAVTDEGEGYAPFDDFEVGDIVFFSADKGRFKVTNQPTRVYGMSLSIGEDGVERITQLETADAIELLPTESS